MSNDSSIAARGRTALAPSGRGTAENLFYSAVRLAGDGDRAGAEAAYRQALDSDPCLAEAHANLALLLEKDRRFAEAETRYRRAIALAPGRAQIHLNYAVMLAAQRRFAAAEALYRTALDLDRDSPAAWSNLGVLLACTKREDEAERCYRRALELDPDHALARFNLAYILLRGGRFEEGWRRYEARKLPAWLGPFVDRPRWKGEALHGRSILITIEAGHGDMIQFCRYAALVKAAGAKKLSLLCHPGLKRLLSSLQGVDETISLDEPCHPDAWDYWTPVLSLPFVFRTGLDTIPARIPYLFADREPIDRWAATVRRRAQACCVGLVWKGNPKFENDGERSLSSVALLSPLFRVPNTRFFSLQKGAGEREEGEQLSLTALGPELEDFADTAAVVMNLDLVITVDTAVAHLAGALGKPCWVLLPDYKTDWRWLVGRRDSPWYPGVMRLFRQKKAGDWASVIEEIAAALAQFVAPWAAKDRRTRRTA